MPQYTIANRDLLYQLVEEASEIIKEVMKGKRFGLDGSPEWIAEGHKSPRENIVQEIGDVQVIVEDLIESGEITEGQLSLARANKRARMKQFYGESAPKYMPPTFTVLPIEVPPEHPDPDATHYINHGVWQPNADPEQGRVLMFKHRVDGYLLYEDHVLSREKNLPIAPWTVIHV